MTGFDVVGSVALQSPNILVITDTAFTRIRKHLGLKVCGRKTVKLKKFANRRNRTWNAQSVGPLIKAESLDFIIRFFFVLV